MAWRIPMLNVGLNRKTWYRHAKADLLGCDDCGKTTLNQYYMLHDELWDAIAAKDANLCISCCEKRLGRKLVPNDFQPIPMNFMEEMKKFKSPELIERLGL